MIPPKRTGLTLTELLVVMAILGLLAGLLLPAVQQARESARMTQCRSNLRQLGVAMHNYHNAHHIFPPGCVGMANDPVNVQGWGWGTFLLPFVEEQSLYDALAPSRNTLPAVLVDAARQPLLRTVLPIFRCGSDSGDDLQSDERTLSGFVLDPPSQTAALISPSSGSGVFLLACISPAAGGNGPAKTVGYGVKAATSNYVASFGDLSRTDGAAWTEHDFAGNGAFGSNASLRMRDFTDGTSQTIAIGERGWQSYASIWAGTDGWNHCEREGVAMVMATAFYPINSTPEPYYLSCDPKGAAGYSSSHPGGAHFLMVDGSVRLISEDIQFANDSDPSRLGAFQRLARRNDGQTLDER